MECRVVISALSDYLDGSLATQESLSIETHLIQCVPCNTFKADLSQITLAAKELPLHTPSRALWVRIQNELELEMVVTGAQTEKKVKKASLWKQWSERRFTFTLPQLAGASTLAFSLMVFGLYHTLHRDPTVMKEATASVLLPMENEIQSKIQQKANRLNSRRQAWNPEIRTVYDTNLQRIDSSLNRVRQTWITSRDQDQQRMLMDLYNEKLQLMEDFEKIEK
ncbi:MAG TPA: zf-HC2 domain-containing protein [Blastocatellia bacterium]|nr:zf-HC2 domain-containing protein [Blastocatellia bacterium]